MSRRDRLLSPSLADNQLRKQPESLVCLPLTHSGYKGG